MPAVLITGAGRGFGRALFRVYAEEGWTLYPLVRDPADVQDLQADHPDRCHPIVGDVASQSIEDRIGKVLGGQQCSLDLLINNAGHIKKVRGFARTSPEELEDLFRVHCTGVFRCARAALPFLEKAARPVVINISSRWGSIRRTLSGKGGGIYSYQIAKCAQNMLTACMDQELRSRGIRVFAVHPGKLMTEAGAADADTPPLAAARRLADWVRAVDENTPCGFHDLTGGGLLNW